MSMSEAARATFGWDAELNHAPQSPVDKAGKFYAPCRCGYEGKLTSTPSHAYNATRVHAVNANARDRGEPPPGDDAKPPGTPARASAGSRSVSRGTPGTPTPCGCGCGESSGGLFRPGHDSKLISRLVKDIKSGAKTLADAHAEMDTIGTSDKLKAKLTQKAS